VKRKLQQYQRDMIALARMVATGSMAERVTGGSGKKKESIPLRLLRAGSLGLVTLLELEMNGVEARHIVAGKASGNSWLLEVWSGRGRLRGEMLLGRFLLLVSMMIRIVMAETNNSWICRRSSDRTLFNRTKHTLNNHTSSKLNTTSSFQSLLGGVKGYIPTQHCCIASRLDGWIDGWDKTKSNHAKC
jgi:hypothetical protein